MEISEGEKYRWAVSEQGFAGSFEDWIALDADTRAEYEIGAGGDPGHFVWMSADYTDDGSVEGDNLQTMQAELAGIDVEAPWITVYDEWGFVRGWISGSGWRYA